MKNASNEINRMLGQRIIEAVSHVRQGHPGRPPWGATFKLKDRKDPRDLRLKQSIGTNIIQKSCSGHPGRINKNTELRSQDYGLLEGPGLEV